jgi:hypothetical protein
MKALLQIVTDIRDAVGDLFAPVQDLAQMMVSGLVWGLKQAVIWVRSFIDVVRNFFGLRRAAGGADLGGSSVGKGTASVSFTDSTDAWKKVVAATYGMGRGEKEADPVVGIAQEVKGIATVLKDIKLVLDAISTAVAVGKNAGGAVQSAGVVADGALALANPLYGLMRDFFRMQELKRG